MRTEITSPVLLDQTGRDMADKLGRLLQAQQQVVQQLSSIAEAIGEIQLSGDTDMVRCTGITLSSAQAQDYVGASVTLTATLTPVNTTQTLKWYTSDERIATVSGGVVQLLGEGTAYITAACGSQSAQCQITAVDPNRCAGIAITGGEAQEADIGDTLTLTAVLTPTSCTQPVTWATSDDTIAAVQGGTVTFLRAGLVTITASCGGYSAQAAFTVHGVFRTFTLSNGKLTYSSDHKTFIRQANSMRAVVSPELMYIGQGHTVRVSLPDATYAFACVCYQDDNSTADISLQQSPGEYTTTGGLTYDPGWQTGTFTLTSTNWTHMGIQIRRPDENSINAAQMTTLLGLMTIEVM